MDPIDISKILPDGAIHVDRAGGYYKVDLWLKNIVMHGLSQIYLKEVCGRSINRETSGFDLPRFKYSEAKT